MINNNLTNLDIFSKNTLKSFLSFLVIIIGFSMPIIPEIGTTIIVICGIIVFLSKKFKLLTIKIYSIWLLIHLIASIRQDSIVGIFETIFSVFIFFGLNWLIPRWNAKRLSLGVLFGLIFISIYSLFNFWKPAEQPWSVDPNLGKSELRSDLLYVTPISKTDSWILKPLLINGTGKITHVVEIKAERPIRLNMFILQADEIAKRDNKICNVQIFWTRCEIEYAYKSTRGLYFGVGTLGTWKIGDPKLVLRDPRIVSLERSDFFQGVLDASRVSGFMFNENAFGATAALIGILVLGIVGWSWLGILSSVFAVFAMFMSGSRGAWLAFLIGFVVLLLGKNRVYKLIPVAVFVLVASFGVLQFSILRKSVASPSLDSPSIIRRINTSNGSSLKTRIEIWRLALQSWLETPATILFGTGDLRNAMQSHIDTRTIQAGFTKETITHAHSLWLQTLGESGLVGLFTLIGLLSVVLVQAWHKRDVTAIALLNTILIINSVDYLFFFASVQFFFWMSVAGFRNSDTENFL